MESEIWRDIPNYEGHYKASNLGRIFSVKSNKLLSTKVSKGYSRISLHKDGVKHSFLTHRIIIHTFHGESGLQVDHINGIKTDNRLDNLRYATTRENSTYYFEKADKSVKSVGVRITNTNRYESRILLNGRRYIIGTFNTEQGASEAYNKALCLYEENGELPLEKVYSSKYKGVSKKHGKYSASITINRKQHSLGSYDIEEEASEAYQKALYNWENFKILPNYVNPNKVSKYEGIYYVKNRNNKPWKASVKIADRREYIGYYCTEEEAREAQLKYLTPNS